MLKNNGVILEKKQLIVYCKENEIDLSCFEKDDMIYSRMIVDFDTQKKAFIIDQFVDDSVGEEIASFPNVENTDGKKKSSKIKKGQKSSTSKMGKVNKKKTMGKSLARRMINVSKDNKKKPKIKKSNMVKK